MLRFARTSLLSVLPAELLLMVVLVSGVPLPGPVIIAAEMAVVMVFCLVAATAYRLFRGERLRGADRRTALWATVHCLVPVQVRRLTEFELKGMTSLALWIARRRNGVPPGETLRRSSGRQRATDDESEEAGPGRRDQPDLRARDQIGDDVRGSFPTVTERPLKRSASGCWVRGCTRHLIAEANAVDHQMVDGKIQRSAQTGHRSTILGTPAGG